MKTYQPQNKRVVGVFGHRGSGKTSLVEACLFNAGATSRLGSVEAGTQHLETDLDAIERQTTMHANVGFCEWSDTWIGVIDTPGDSNFWGATNRVFPVIDAAVLVVSGVDGLEPQTLRCAQRLKRDKIPFAVYVTKVDKEGEDIAAVLDDLRADVSPNIAQITLPMGEAADFSGVVSLIGYKAHLPDGKSSDVPESMASDAANAREQMIDSVAAADDDLMEKYLEEGSLTEDELGVGMKAGVVKGEIVPVFFGVPTSNTGVVPLLDFIKTSFPSPLERGVVKGTDRPAGSADDAEVVERRPGEGDLVAQVFRTHHDAFAGNLSFARVFAGSIKPSTDLYNATTQHADRPSHLYIPLGSIKNGAETKEATTGDLVALTKLKSTSTGDSLSSKEHPIVLPPFGEPDALLKFGITAVDTKEEEKVSQAVHRFIEEDPSLVADRDPETKDLLLGGLGQQHIDFVVNRLKRQGLEVVLKDPTVPYRETLRAPVMNVEGKHKKQTGGSGQFGVCFINVEPLPRGSGIEFANKIVGGSIPRQYIPSVEKGVRSSLDKGPLTGHEVVDLRITVYDGKYHSVDSSDVAFQMAARKAIKAAFTSPKAKPVILEPYMHLDITCPGDMVGDVMGDLNSRRGRVQNMETEGKRGKISASVPMSEVLKYTTVLKSLTSGKGAFSMHFEKYEEAPQNIAQEVMAAYTSTDVDDH